MCNSLKLVIIIFIFCNNCDRTSKEELLQNARRTLGVLPNPIVEENLNKDLISLGKKLFLDSRLSIDNTVSCNSCHNVLNNGSGTDNRRVSVGINKQEGGRNSPTVLNSRFNNFLNGDVDAIDGEEAKGLEIFLSVGCISCHSGPGLGGRFFRKIGIVYPYSNTIDKGRYEVTKNDEDLYLFKVPSLRNVGKTAPYFHDGASPTLEDAVRQMAWMQLGRNLTNYEVYYLVKFLNSLSGSIIYEDL
ncbi:MAG: c-type cytochrome [Leptospiraceae bacterium]|nr:c-type cytochrome [Leptospiraceae bacterium]